MTTFEVLVRPLPGSRDPQADAVSTAMRDSGFAGCAAVAVGRFLLLAIDEQDEAGATARAHAVCQGLLVNPNLETYELRGVGFAVPPGHAGRGLEPS